MDEMELQFLFGCKVDIDLDENDLTAMQNSSTIRGNGYGCRKGNLRALSNKASNAD